MKVVVHQDASDEAFDAACRYELEKAGLGVSFLNEYETVVRRIAERPERYPLLETAPPECGIRRGITKRFPYLVVYEVHADYCQVLAVAHAARRPSYWLLRRRGIS